MCKLALKPGCKRLRTIKAQVRLAAGPQEPARRMETISHWFLNQGMRQRLLGLLLAPCSIYKRLFWGPAFFLSKCLKLPGLAASAPLNYVIIVPLSENSQNFLKGSERLHHLFSFVLALPPHPSLTLLLNHPPAYSIIDLGTGLYPSSQRRRFSKEARLDRQGGRVEKNKPRIQSCTAQKQLNLVEPLAP